MFTRYSWLIFVVIGAIGAAMSLMLMVNPSAGLSMLGAVAPPAPADAARDPFTLFVFRWTATALFGVNAITIIVAATGFRRGEQWAGVALMYWPLMFASHLLMYRWSPMSGMQVFWLSITVPALVAHFRRVAPAPLAAPSAAAAG